MKLMKNFHFFIIFLSKIDKKFWQKLRLPLNISYLVRLKIFGHNFQFVRLTPMANAVHHGSTSEVKY